MLLHLARNEHIVEKCAVFRKTGRGRYCHINSSCLQYLLYCVFVFVREHLLAVFLTLSPPVLYEI